MSEDTRVEDEELLYRSLELIEDNFSVDEETKKIVASAEAFADRNKEPSLYRHDLCESAPHSNPPRMNGTDILAQLVAFEIRKEEVKQKPPEKNEDQKFYIFDVVPDTSNDQHQSHAVVKPSPGYQSPRHFEKLKKKLAILSRKRGLIFLTEEFSDLIQKARSS